MIPIIPGYKNNNFVILYKIFYLHFCAIENQTLNFMKVKNILLFSSLFAIATVVTAQDPWVYAKQATEAWPGATAKAALLLDDGVLSVGEIGLLDIMEGEVLMVKTDEAGNVLWEQSHDKPGHLEIVNRISQTADGGFLIATMLAPDYRPWFVKTDDAGNMIWQSAAWSDLLGENTASQTMAYQLPSGDIACVVANDVFRQLDIYTVDNATGNLISTTTHLYEDIIGLSLFSASTSDIVATTDGGFLFATRFGIPDTFYNQLTKIDAGLNIEDGSPIGMAIDNFFPAQININSDGSVIISGVKNTGFIGDNYQAAIATFNASYDYTGIEMVSGGLLHSNCGEITQTPSGNYKLIRYNYSGDFWDMAVGDYVEVVNLNASFIETDATSFNYAPYNTLEFITATADDQYITGGMAWTIGEPNYYLVIASGAGDEVPACIFNCVWPGDADNSGLTDMDDVLALGLGYGATGDMRDDMSIAWYAHSANDWATALPSGTNHKYTDCNGDGIINDGDTIAISNNFSFEHAVYTLKTTEGELPLSFAPTGALHIGLNTIPIVLGDAINSADAIYGLRFNIIVDGENIDATTIKVQFNDSFLGATNDLIYLSKTNAELATVYAVVAKTNQINASGYGEIGTLSFVVIDNIAGKADADNVQLSFENVKAIDVTNTELSILSTNTSIESPTDIQTIASNVFTISPNPVSGNEIQITTNESILAIGLYNSYGEKVLFSNDLNTKTLRLPELPMGQYLLQIQTNKGISSQKLVILGQ